MLGIEGHLAAFMAFELCCTLASRENQGTFGIKGGHNHVNVSGNRIFMTTSEETSIS